MQSLRAGTGRIFGGCRQSQKMKIFLGGVSDGWKNWTVPGLFLDTTQPKKDTKQVEFQLNDYSHLPNNSA